MAGLALAEHLTACCRVSTCRRGRSGRRLARRSLYSRHDQQDSRDAESYAQYRPLTDFLAHVHRLPPLEKAIFNHSNQIIVPFHVFDIS
jgi:hypothetical protein